MTQSIKPIIIGCIIWLIIFSLYPKIYSYLHKNDFIFISTNFLSKIGSLLSLFFSTIYLIKLTPKIPIIKIFIYNIILFSLLTVLHFSFMNPGMNTNFYDIYFKIYNPTYSLFSGLLAIIANKTILKRTLN